ncbi:type II toxin-antitoxin system PemK/MazF family toxin [Cyclobacterium plantarum]|uniref:mRNA interferase n=1 Tax=Cyclobacterium plantarum TaxID=2716263 RepID=A0ABX0HCW9_9BACT|nr:type II toxin-antitoxin system PemK/MazF family toxin [Cyclobacterium plantarum]NHE57815.1 type II toxin-antitoxin system PemK/MazF family toxin [Cyclobacterium plantarum]
MKQGEIWLLNLDPTVGAEIKKTRPAIIVNDDTLGKLPLKIIVSVTDWKDRYQIAPWMIKLIPDSENGLTKVSAADTFQIRSVSKERFVKKVGLVSESIREQIRIGLSKVLSIDIE